MTAIQNLAQAMQDVSDALGRVHGPGDAETRLTDALLSIEDEILSTQAVTLGDAFIQLRAVASILDDIDEALSEAVRSAMEVIGESDPPGQSVYNVRRAH